jgi:hypothetical protein
MQNNPNIPATENIIHIPDHATPRTQPSKTPKPSLPAPLQTQAHPSFRVVSESRLANEKARSSRLESKGGTSLLLVSTELEVLAPLEGHLGLCLAGGALETEDNLLGLLGEG